jgi:hypothetical protein
MAASEKNRYPQIPGTVWWGVRSILQKTPGIVVDERILGIHLQVQAAAAKQYVTELKAVGILDAENKATPLALKWRLDEKYEEAVSELIASVYPESLRQIAPPEEGDRQKVVRWFLGEGLGQGAAGNKAATYLLVGSPSPIDGAVKGAPSKAARDEVPARSRVSAPTATLPQGKQAKASVTSGSKRQLNPESVPLNINLQIHIGADAGSEQIEGYIFCDEALPL